MKDIEKNDTSDVPGGFSPGDGGCYPPLPNLVPDDPYGPLPKPLPGINDPNPFVLEK